MTQKELNNLVNQITQNAINRIAPEARKRYHVKSGCQESEANRYKYYQRKINDIKGYEIRGEPDTFIEAACMCEALITFKSVHFDVVKLFDDANVEMYKEIGSINYSIALDVALAMIGKTSVYEEEDGKWVEIPKHMDKKIDIPIGIIPNAPLRERIIRNLSCRDIAAKNFDTFGFSNTLHLIYLSNQ
ncbi:MAG: hypothetical protein HFJ55_00150 [Clostridia bacterium]|nr:hypothetical protein [Clostridia bacterium]